MIDNVSHASYSMIFPGECDCTFGFHPIFPFSPVTLQRLLCLLLSRLKAEADIGIVAFHKTFREFLYFHILKMRIVFVMQDF